MAAIDDLINQISDTDLRDRIKAEVDKINSRKKFGLVFEEHLPESTPLFDVPIRVGSVVGSKTGYMKDNYVVTAIDGENATCINRTTKEEAVFKMDELVCVAQFGEPIYPYLKPIDSVCNAPDSDLWHTLIEADNYHALQLLEYLYAGKVDCIYIDPPYNTGARDWKYNNDYVDSTDQYRHSKWLSMMKKRLLLAKSLLNPKDSVLIVTIDEKEYLHLGCLLEELFSEARIQMITTVISAKGVVRNGQFSRVEEYIYILEFGNSSVQPGIYNMLDDDVKKESDRPIEWLGFRRRAPQAKRNSRPNQFYPVFVSNTDGRIISIGDVVTHGVDRNSISVPDGCTALWPLSKDGDERLWSLVPEQARLNLEKGYLRVNNWNTECRTGTVYYLASGTIDDIENGKAEIVGYNPDGSVEAIYRSEGSTPPKRVWNMKTHNAETYGTNILNSVIGNRFDYPKSIYAVHDTIRFYVKRKKNALIIDFFSGSGTTLHAVNMLNTEDDGNRRCIMVTNNEVSEEEAKTLTEQGYQPGDEEWEKLGIARYVTWPRTVCSIEGHDINGNKLEDDYISSNTIDKETKRTFKQLKFIEDAASLSISDKKQLVTILSNKVLPQTIVQNDCRYIVSEEQNHTCSILFDESSADEWLEALKGMDHIVEFYIFTKKNKIFKSLKDSISDMLGNIITKEQIKIPMADGFKANAAYFKLGFLDKNFVALGKQFKELLSVFWMKAGAIGKCPTIESEELPDMLVLPENKFAVLIDETAYKRFVAEIEKHPEIKTIYIVTDSENAYKEMIRCFEDKDTYQLYRDYLDNFRINVVR
jgi:adenine-specific DNA-methyltransferase